MQRSAVLFTALLAASGVVIAAQMPDSDVPLRIALKSSGPYIGADIPAAKGYDGAGITIGIIDTGVDYTHPDLFGLGPDGKVSMAYDFFGGDDPLDSNGHGTEVAGIIAADGILKGVAPKAKLVSYKVSEDGEGVSSELIVKAINQAVSDNVDIINISLGVNRTNPGIDSAVSDAISRGIVVVAAAGNDGPYEKTIGSPGRTQNAITVGASYNNLTSSLVATLEIKDRQFLVFPMVATPAPEQPVTAQVMFGNYSRELDYEGGSFEGALILAERGSDTDELVYFSDKEEHAAAAGAAGLIVYNNEDGIYLGELIHEYIKDGYAPTIPTVSISRQDGLEIRSMMTQDIAGTLRIFYNPDYVAGFSSRGPVSPFYIKPDLVAPGVFINTTLTEGRYNSTSGTSFATPHVSGAAALLLQKTPGLEPHEVKSIMTSTADFVSDAYGEKLGFESAGSGRLNITRAFGANLVFLPEYLSFDLSPAKKTDTEVLKIKPLSGNIGNLDVSANAPEGVNLSYKVQDDSIVLTAELAGKLDRPDGTLEVSDKYTEYNIALLFRSTNGSIATTQEKGDISFDVIHPQNWTYAKVSITDAQTGWSDTVSLRPDSDGGTYVHKNGTYWIEAKIESGGSTLDAFEKITVGGTIQKDVQFFEYVEVPQRQIILAAAIAAAAGVIGLIIKSAGPPGGSQARRPGTF